MQPLDADNDASTKSSSGATVTVTQGSRVLYAGLFWGAATKAGTGGTGATGTNYNQIRLRTPGAANYQTITASRTPDRLANQGLDYSSYADVTDLVRSSGTGMYWGADIPMATGADRYAGWSIVMVVSHPSMPLRDLNVFGGYASVQNTDTVGTTISGFLTPAAGPVNARFGTVTFEGDNQLTGDYLAVGNTRLADAASSSSNFFNSKVTNRGAPLTDRVPANVNNMAVDAKVIDAPGVVPNGATSANITFGTDGDFYYPAALTTQIDLYAPTVQGTKSVVNLSGNDVAKVGDVLEYTTSFSNTGQDPADAATMNDTLPAGLTYQPGSLRITGANAGTKTDAAGDDQAEVTGQTVRARLGTGANATTGGRLANGDTATVRFGTPTGSPTPTDTPTGPVPPTPGPTDEPPTPTNPPTSGPAPTGPGQPPTSTPDDPGRGPDRPGPGDGILGDTGSSLGLIGIGAIGLLLIGGIAFLVVGRVRRQS